MDGVTIQMNEHSFILSEARHKIKKFLPRCGNLWSRLTKRQSGERKMVTRPSAPATLITRAAAIVVYRRGLVLSLRKRGHYKGRCDACSAGAPPAMVVYRFGLVLSSMDTVHVLIAGLLGRCDALASQRPSVARAAWSYGGDWKGGDHAARAPAACLEAWIADFVALPVECPVPICAGGVAVPGCRSGTNTDPAHLGGECSLCPVRVLGGGGARLGL